MKNYSIKNTKMFSRKNKKEGLYKGWSVLWKYLSVYKKELVTLSVLGTVSALANGTIPYVSGKFFDAILKQDNIFFVSRFSIPLWIALLVLWGVIQIIAIITDWLGDVKGQTFGVRIFGDYKVNAFSQLFFLPISFHKEQKIGEVVNVIDRSAGDGIYAITKQVVIGLAPKFLSIVVGLGFCFYMNISLALVLVLGILSYIFITIRLVPKTISLDREMNKQYGEAYGFTYEAVNNSIVIKQSVAEIVEKTKIKNLFDQANRLYISLSRVWSNLNFSSRMIIFLTQIIIFVLSVLSIHMGIMTLGELLAFNAYAAMVFGPFVVLGQNWQTLQNGLIALEQAENIISTPTENYAPKDALTPKETQGIIEFKNVSFAYKNGNQVLQNISFTALPGQMVALVGESGAGKSTLIDLISAYYFPANGIVAVDGIPTDKWNLKELRGMIAVVPQEVALFNDTIAKNLTYGPINYTEQEIKNATKDAHADHFIEKFPDKYEQIVGERGVKLSVGQKQRIAIARAILRNPKILILDEPTSALDSETEKFVTDALNRVISGRTTFVIAHRLSTVRRADKILVLESGVIVETGTHNELMTIDNGIYRRRYELHVGLV